MASASPQRFTALPDAHPTGVWGKPTSTIDWCEENYAVTKYVAEWWNTISNLTIILAGIYALGWVTRYRHETRFVVLSYLCIIVGLGSAAFHGTLLFHFQLFDELPMVYALTCWWYIWFESPRKKPRRYMLPALVGMDILVTFVHSWYGFTDVYQLFFAMLCFVGFYHVWLAVRMPSADKSLYILAAGYMLSVTTGVTIWKIDQHYCTSLRLSRFGNPQLHAWWHFLVGVNTIFCVPLVCYARGLHMDTSPRLLWVGSSSMMLPGLPTVVIDRNGVSLNNKDT